MIIGTIIAGGKSNRMGQDKGLINFKGKPLVQYGIDFLGTIASRVVINSNNVDYANFELPIIKDKICDIGPMGGIYSVLSEINSEIFCIPCDMPYFNRDIAEQIIQHIGKYDCIVPKHPDGKLEPLYSYYSPTIIPLFDDYLKIENYKMQSLIEQANTKYIETQFIKKTSQEIDFINLNTPEDFKEHE